MKPSRSSCSFTNEFALIQEAILVQNERITQLYTIQSERDPFLWFGVLFVDSGIYMGAVIRFTMVIDESYPNCSCPRIVLDPIPYHPLVEPETGELDTKNAFSDWDSKTNKIHELLLFLKRVICNAELYIGKIQELLNQHHTNNTELKVIEDNGNAGQVERRSSRVESTISKDDLQRPINQATDNSSNHDRVIMGLFKYFDHTLDFIRTYENEPQKFHTLVDTFKQTCNQNLYERPPLFGDDRNSLIFAEWNHDTHEPIRNCILAGKYTPVSLFASYHKETDSVSFVPGAEPPDR